MQEQELLEKLSDLVYKAVRENLKEVKGEPLGVVFSGGVDSSLLAKIVLDLGYRPVLFSAGLEGFFKDKPFVESFAEELGLRSVLVEVSKEEVLDLIEPISSVLDKVGIDSTHPMQVSLGIPFYLVAREGVSMGIKNFICAQGGDELLGGGFAHLKVPTAKLNKRLRSDFQRLLAVDQVRDKAMFSHFGATLYYPLIQKEFSDFVLDLGPEWKIKHDLGEIGRKYIWRQLAVKYGVPPANASRKKHAMQYSSGFWRVVKKEMGSDRKRRAGANHRPAYPGFTE